MRRSAAAMVFAMTMAACTSPGSNGPVLLKDLPHGVSFQKIDGQALIIVRDGPAITAFVPDARHLPGEHTLWWCPRERVFTSPTHGEVFDIEGHHLDGPARGDLNRVAVTVEGGRLVAGTRVEVGGPRPVSRTIGNDGRAWNVSAASFCRGAVKPSH